MPAALGDVANLAKKALPQALYLTLFLFVFRMLLRNHLLGKPSLTPPKAELQLFSCVVPKATRADTMIKRVGVSV